MKSTWAGPTNGVSRRTVIAAIVLPAVLGGARSAGAATYPSEPVRIIVPYPAGTTTDLFARQLGAAMSDGLKQRVLVDNRGGADAIVGATLAARSAPDGYTLLLGTSQTQAINAALHDKLPYDPVADFAPIARLATQAEIMAISGTLPAKTVAEFVAYAKTMQGKLNFASTGVGSVTHLAGAYFSHLAGLNMAHVPYKSASQAFSDLAAGDVAMMFYPYLALKPQVDAGKLRILATASAARLSYLPDLPTLAESGYKDMVLSIWFALYAPKGTPRPAIDTIYNTLQTAMTRPELVQSLAATGTDVSLCGPDELASFTQAEVKKYQTLVQLSGAHAE